MVSVGVVWVVHDKLLQAQTEEYGSSPLLVAVKAVESSTIKQYLQQVQMLLQGRECGGKPETAIWACMQTLALCRRGDWAAKILVSAITMLENHRLVPNIIHEGHWLQVRAVGRMASQVAHPLGPRIRAI